MKHFRLIFFHFLLLYSSLAWTQLPDFYGRPVYADICTQLGVTEDEKVRSLVTRILDVYNIDNTYIIQACTGIKNCVATQRNGIQYILYDPQFMEDIRVLSFTESEIPVSQGQWNHLMVLAHEVGHHMNNHLINPLGLKPRDMELKADETAGFILYQLGAPDLETACKVLRSSSISETGSASHPPRMERLAAFKKGWDKAAEKLPRSGTIKVLNCISAQVNGELVAGQMAKEVSVSIPYNGGNGGNHSGQSVQSTGVIGLTATLPSGRFANGDSSLRYLINGVPLGEGITNFEINTGGKLCTISLNVSGLSGNKGHLMNENGGDSNCAKPATKAAVIKNLLVGKFILVKGGTFFMGCTNEQGVTCDEDEIPVHQIALSDYYIGETEVTQAQWRAVVGNDPSELRFKGCDECPVDNVSWDNVQDFILKLNRSDDSIYYRLPTEAEWEYAARGGCYGKGYRYSGSNDPDEVAWYGNNADSKTHPVKGKKANELGIFDMSGNVWEWCSDWKGNYPSENLVNPTGPTKGIYRVYRGGSWGNNAGSCRMSSRSGSGSGYHDFNLGFRLVLATK
jgi:formylglycine-generating enzyme required for sulfatase activity